MISITHKENCCGCTACASVCPKGAIVLKEDSEGFFYPSVDRDLCVDCGLCEKVCPFLHSPSSSSVPQGVYAAKCRDEELRKQSSSGGVFSLLAYSVLDEGGVVFGARFDERWEVCHGYAETREELSSFRGSKYVQSRMGDAYLQALAFLKAGRKVLFTGTSCQIMGLKRFLRCDYPNLLTAECLCHGVPSPKVWKRYIEELSVDGRITQISFRDKRKGWKNYEVLIRQRKTGNNVETDRVREPFYHNLYMRGFLSDLYLRPSCYACRAKNGRCGSDLTIADFWAVPLVDPAFDDDKGCSLVLVHTERGSEMCRSLDIEMAVEEYTPSRERNGGFCEHLSIPRRRRAFFAALDSCRSVSGLIRYALDSSFPVFFLKVCMQRLLSVYPFSHK